MTEPLISIKLGLRPDEVAEVIGSEQLFREMVAAGWLQPAVRRHKITLYDRSHVAAAWARMLSGEEVPPIPRRRKLASGNATVGA